jgi:BolA protein
VQRQKLVYGLLADEMAGPVHALSLALSTPEEAGESTPE